MIKTGENITYQKSRRCQNFKTNKTKSNYSFLLKVVANSDCVNHFIEFSGLAASGLGIKNQFVPKLYFKDTFRTFFPKILIIYGTKIVVIRVWSTLYENKAIRTCTGILKYLRLEM